MEKYGAAREGTDGEKIWRIQDVICIEDNLGENTDTLVIFSNHCFATAKMVTRTHHKVTLYVPCLSYSNVRYTEQNIRNLCVCAM
jgi:hypothetical protein